MRFKILVTYTLALLAFVGHTHAQSPSSGPVRIVIGFTPGGGIDNAARIIAPKLGEILGQPVIVDNRPGAGGISAMQEVARAAPDGHTIFLGTAGNIVINQFVYPTIPYKVERDFAPLTQFASVSFLVYVSSSLPIKSISDLTAYAKAHPKELNYGTPGSGSLPHLASELLSTRAGLQAAHIPYKGSAPALNDLIGGQIQFFFRSLKASGKIRAIATTSPKRLPGLEDIPTVAETIPGFAAVNWYGMLVPAKTPRPVIDRLHAALLKVTSMPEVRTMLSAQGIEPVVSRPDQFATYMKSESAKWSKVVKDANIKVD